MPAGVRVQSSAEATVPPIGGVASEGDDRRMRVCGLQKHWVTSEVRRRGRGADACGGGTYFGVHP